MIALRCKAPGKVNLCLFVGCPRADGYHPLVSLVQPVSLADELELGLAPRGYADAVICPGVEGENLAAKALAAFRAHTGWDAPPLRLTIAKRIPTAGGMGGGSADAAAALRLAAYAAQLPDIDLYPIAIGLGADVPSLLAPERCLMTGIGEEIRPLGDADPLGILIIPLPYSLPTPAVYRAFDQMGLGRDADALDRLSGQVSGAASDSSLHIEGLLHNDLEAPARSLCPAIGGALQDVRAAGATRALVSGSGPTVVGLFEGADGPLHARAAAELLRSRHPEVSAADPVGRAFSAPREA